ncbi:MAG: hypothetical protein P4L33_10230 [Capsulimonadaceae bacterium]|nr:hypothetical protein [Capsulimonadaceae bacterium]
MKHTDIRNKTLKVVIALIAILTAAFAPGHADVLIAGIPSPDAASTASAPPSIDGNVAINEASARPSHLTVHGSFFERYRNDVNHDNGGITSQGAVTYGVVRADYGFSRALSVFGRLGGEGITQGGQGRDFNGSYYQGTHGYRGALALDQGGVTYADKPRGLTIVAGRQDKALDATSTIYDQSWKVGRYSFMDGVSIDQVLGAATIEFDAFSQDQYVTVNGTGQATRDGLYAARGTYNVTPAVQVGALVDRFESSGTSQASGIMSTTNYEADVVWQATRALQVKGEGGRSDASLRNDLYFGSVKYSVTRRDSLTALTYKIGQNADVGQGTAYPNNNRGERYFYEHDFDKHVSITFYHEIDHQLYAPGNSSSDQVTLAYGF